MAAGTNTIRSKNLACLMTPALKVKMSDYVYFVTFHNLRFDKLILRKHLRLALMFLLHEEEDLFQMQETHSNTPPLQYTLFYSS